MRSKGASVWGMDTGGVVHREVRSGVRQGAFWPQTALQTPEEVKLCDVGGPLAALGSEKDLGNSASTCF